MRTTVTLQNDVAQALGQLRREQGSGVSEAWEQVEEWLDAPAAWVPEPTREHRRVLGTLLGEHHVTGNLVSDAHLAAPAR